MPPVTIDVMPNPDMVRPASHAPDPSISVMVESQLLHVI